ncbi:glycosyltransferase [Candidatus Saccharibacteria bacterium]|nr:glycosyltransferase [Candidatus Saccharibacteria bacterium]
MATKKLKLLVLSHTSELLGGAERSLLDVFDALGAKYPVEPEFILREPLKSLAGALKSRGWSYHKLRYTFWSDGNPPRVTEDIWRQALQNSQAVKAIERLIQRIKPDVIITNTLISPWAALAAHWQQMPHIWFVREYGDLDHGRVFEIGRQPTLTDIGQLSNLVVANSETMAGYLAKYIEPAKITTLYNPFDLNKLAEQAKVKVKTPFKYPDSLKLIITSNIARTKGQLEAVKAAGQLHRQGLSVELCLMGRGEQPLIDEIRALAKHYAIGDRVHLTGLRPNALAYVALADVGIVASRREGFGRTTFEYLAIGKPVLGANSGATPEIVRPGCGLLFKPGDAASLAVAMAKYAKDRTLVTKQGAAARRRAQAMMAGEHNIDRLYERLVEVAAGRGPGKLPPLNFAHRWLDYTEIADQFIRESGQTSLYRTARLRLRQKAKGVYYRGRGMKAKLTGK